jgi:chromosome segregation ATPase
MVEQTRKSKESSKRDMAQLKQNYQAQLEQMREFYGNQNAALQNELKSSYAAQLEGIKKNYEGLSASNQRQLETIQKYLEDKLVGELKEKVSQLEQDKLSNELRLAELVQDLDKRNAEVVSLKEHLHQFDDGIPEVHKEMDSAQSRPPEPVNDQQQELLKIVKEVAAAQQQELVDLKELEDEPEEEEKQGFWGSKAGKRFGLF